LKRREWVVDASVAIKLYVEEDLSEEATRFLKGSYSRFYVPDFLFLECSNILLKYCRKSSLSLEAAQEHLYRLQRLRFLPVRVPPFLALVIRLASQHELTSYDASYATLARSLAIPLVTADEKMIRKLKGSDVDVRWLGDLSL
jgi:predicted nucleic acid-binding protein